MDYAAVDGNLRESFRVLARHSRTGEVREYAGVSIASAGVAFQMFNAGFLSAEVTNEAELERRIVQREVHFAARRLSWACWTCESWLADGLRKRARQIFRARRLGLSVEMPGMAAERLAPPHRNLPAMEIRRVEPGPTRDDFCAIGSACFHVPLHWFQEVFGADGVWNEFVSWVGYVDGQPVSTAATVFGAGVVGVYNVATLPEHQRHGYGEAVMRHALEQARREHSTECTILQATTQGMKLYERMGYRTVTRVAVYSS